MSGDKHLELARLQKEIGDHIGIGHDNLIFNYDEKKSGHGGFKLYLITVNPRHDQSFLFHATEGSDKVDALNAMLDHVKNYKERQSSYTIQWSTRGDKDLQTSYFYAKNIVEALDKLFYDRDPNSIKVFSVNLNPIT